MQLVCSRHTQWVSLRLARESGLAPLVQIPSVLYFSANMEQLPQSGVIQAKPPVNYAGFWLRLVAALVDWLALLSRCSQAN